MDWNDIPEALDKWHTQQDRESARAAFTFLEEELRLMIPALVRRTWSEDRIDDALQGFLAKYVEKNLPPTKKRDPKNYFRGAFHHHCVDLYRSYQRRAEQPLEALSPQNEMQASNQQTPDDMAQQEERALRIQEALERLEIDDRVALKLETAPEWLTNEEIDWLVGRLNQTATVVRQLIGAAKEIYDITLIFDPPGSDGPGDRRKRMERFRQRRGRARKQLSEMTKGVL